MNNTTILCVISVLTGCAIGITVMTVMAAVIAAGRADRTIENMEEKNNAEK